MATRHPIPLLVHRATPPATAPKANGDGHWLRLTKAANRAYEQGDTASARTAYEAALVEAERLFAIAMTEPGNPWAPVIHNIACHNLAELAANGGDGAAAEALCRRAYDELLKAARSPATPLLTRTACVRHLARAVLVLVQRLNARDAPVEETGELVDRARATAFAVIHAARHAELADEACPHCSLM